MRHNPHSCRQCDTTETPILRPPYPAKPLSRSTERRIIPSDLSLAASPDRQHCPAVAAVPVWCGLSIQQARRDAKNYVHLLPKLNVPSPLQMDNASQALPGTFSFRRSFCHRQMSSPAHIALASQAKRDAQTQIHSLMVARFTDRHAHAYMSPYTSFFPYTNTIL